METSFISVQFFESLLSKTLRLISIAPWDVRRVNGSSPYFHNVIDANASACAQFLVFRLRALRSRPCRDPRRIGGEFRPLRHQLEHSAPADLAADHHIGCGELLAQNPR